MESFHSYSYANASIQFLYTSQSHSDSIPHHSNSIPVNPEVCIKLPNSSQFHQDKVHNEHITCHFQFHTTNSTIHHNFWPPQLVILVAYLTFEPCHELEDMSKLAQSQNWMELQNFTLKLQFNSIPFHASVMEMHMNSHSHH